MKFPHSTRLLAILFLISFSNLQAQYFNDPDDLADAVNASTNGGVFMVGNGTYNDFEATFEVAATASNPVIVKAETLVEQLLQHLDSMPMKMAPPLLTWVTKAALIFFLRTH